MVYNIFATYGLRKAYLCKPRHMYSRKTIYIYIYMHILDTTYWYLDLVSITYFVYIVHTVHVYIYIYMYIYTVYVHIYIYTCRPRNHSSSNNRLGCWENPPPLPQGGGTIWLGGGRGVGVPAHIYILYIIYSSRTSKFWADSWRNLFPLQINLPPHSFPAS